MSGSLFGPECRPSVVWGCSRAPPICGLGAEGQESHDGGPCTELPDPRASVGRPPTSGSCGDPVSHRGSMCCRGRGCSGLGETTGPRARSGRR